MVRPSPLTLPFQGSPVGTVSSPLPSQLGLTTRGSLPRGASYLAAAAALGQLGPSPGGEEGASRLTRPPLLHPSWPPATPPPMPPPPEQLLLCSPLPSLWSAPRSGWAEGWGGGGRRTGCMPTPSAGASCYFVVFYSFYSKADFQGMRPKTQQENM